MKSHIHFSIDRDLICAIMVGVLGGIVTLAMFFLSGYMITQSATLCINDFSCIC